MGRRSTAKTNEPAPASVIFRHQTTSSSPLGIIYAWAGRSKTRKKMIEECLVHCLLPYAYEEKRPELTQDALQSSIEELQAWIEKLQRNFTLQLTFPESQSSSLSPLEEMVRELRLMRQAINSQSAVVDELKLIRKSLASFSVVGSISSTASPQMEKPKVALTNEVVDSYVNGSTDFIANLEEIL